MNESDLHGYQNVAVDQIISKTHCGLFLDMGLGKTVSTLTAIKRLLHDYLEISSVLVIAPKRVAESVWDAECQKWDHLNDLTVSKIAGSKKQRLEALKKPADIYTLGRDNVAWIISLYKGNLPFDMLVIDESSSFKNPKSKRFKALKIAQPYFKRVVELTGTPTPKGLEDLWSQIYLLDRGERLGKYISGYREKYFNAGKRNGHIVYNYDVTKTGEEQIYAAIEDIVISMKAEDYLDLEETIHNVIKIPFGDELQAKYENFERDMIMEIVDGMEDGAEISAVNAGALNTKLTQFANGAIYDEDKNVHHIHDLKLDAAKDIIEEAQGSPVLIAREYQHDRDRLMAGLKKYKPQELKTDQDIRDWNAGKIPVLIMHPASGGHGLNLQAGGNTVIWFGQTWSLELLQQFNARLARQGQKKAVVINYLCADKSIDLDIMRSQKSKDKTQEGLMAAVKAKIQKYINQKQL